MLPPSITDWLLRQELSQWKTVPGLVVSRIKQASTIQRAVQQLLPTLPALSSGYGAVYLHPEKNALWLVVGDSDDREDVRTWQAALQGIDGVDSLRAESEHFPDDEWIRIKKAGALSWLNAPYELAGKLTGGPSPLSNAVVSGLLGSGAGYAAGTVAEQFLPQSQFERGTLRKRLAALGGLGGVATSVPAALANMGMNQKATGSSHILRSILRGDSAQQVDPGELDWRNHYYGGSPQRQQALAKLAEARLPKEAADRLRAATAAIKLAYDTGSWGSGGVPLHPVPVDEFNNAIWNDVANGNRSPYAGTPPANAAAAVGIVTGIQQMAGNPSVLSPRHFISGLAGAGVDAATATVAGGVLGVLGGMKPDAQKQLQQMGLWGGMIRGVTSSVLGI